MKLHRNREVAPAPAEAPEPTYRARHLRLDVPEDTTSETGVTGGSHALRHRVGMVSRLVRTDADSA